MPSFFNFQQGRESQYHVSASDSSPLLGRFRAVPQRNSLLLSGSALLGSIKGFGESYIGYGTAGSSWNGPVVGDGEQEHYGVDEDGLVGWARRWLRLQEDLWLEPKQVAVARVVSRWWSRWMVLVGMPAVLVSMHAALFLRYLCESTNTLEKNAGLILDP